MAQQIKKTTNNNSKENETKKTNVENNINDEFKKENERLKQESAEKDEKLNELSKKFESLQEQLALLMKTANQGGTNSNEKEPDVLVGCRNVYTDVLATNDNSIVIKFNGCEEKYVDVDDLKTLLKGGGGRNTRRLFEEDTFYFVNPEDYNRFKIKRRVDLSPENLTRILLLDSNSMIDEINEITDHMNRNNHAIITNLQFGIVKLLIDKSNPLKDWKYENRARLEDYLGRKFDDLMAAIGIIDLLGHK